MGETFLLTGAYGFIGAWIIKRLLAANATVVIFDVAENPERLRLIMPESEISRTCFVKGDVTDGNAIVKALEAHAANHLIHLAGLQVPVCRADPKRGAMVNVLGTINVFEAVKQTALVRTIVYASSAAVFGQVENGHAVTERDEAESSSHYGVFKRCNEGNARVYHLDHGINSVGLRPLTVYGVGRDFGLTSDPTKAMKAAVIGRPFHIRFGGRTDFQYVADTADAFVRAATANLQGAHVFNLHGDTVHLTQVVRQIEQAWPSARGTITHADEPLSIPAELDDSSITAALGPLQRTSLADGIGETVARFAELEQQGRLTTSDLDQ